MIRIAGFLLLIGVVVGTACERTQEPVETPPDPTPDPFAVMEPGSTPDTTAASLWEHLQSERYDERWWSYPGRAQGVEGTAPHGPMVDRYVNFIAQDGITNGAARMANQAVIVIESHDREGRLTRVDAMFKRLGFSAETSHWFWASYRPDGTPTLSGRGSTCVGCHTEAEWDYVWSGFAP